MFKELWKSNKTLFKILLAVVLVIVTYAGLLITHDIQTSNRGAVSVTVYPYDGVKGFNVEGLTDEEIAQYLEEYRENVRDIDVQKNKTE